MQNPQIVASSKVITTHSFEGSSPIRSYCPHRGVINCVSWNHTNKVIASCGVDGKMILKVADNPQKSLLELSFDPIKVVSINSCAFSPNSRYIAAGGTDSIVKVWETKSNSRDIYLNLKQHFGSVNSVSWGQLGENEVLASANILGDLYINSVKSGSLIQTFSTKNQDGINMVRISSQGKVAACTNSGSIMVWDVKTNTLICDFKNAHKSTASAISFSTFKPALLVSVSHDQKLNFYDVNDRKPIKTVMEAQEPLTSVNFFGDGHTLVLGGMHGGLFVYDLRMPTEPINRLLGHDSAIKSIDLIHVRDNPKQNTGGSTIPAKSTTTLPHNYHTSSQKGIAIREQQERQLVSQRSANKLITTAKTPLPQTPSVQRPSNLISRETEPMSNNYLAPKSTGSIAPLSLTSLQTPQIPKQSVLLQLQKRLKSQMHQQFQLMHLQIIRQFQIQQKEMQTMVSRLLQADQKKSDYIRKLEEENQRLKKESY